MIPDSVWDDLFDMAVLLFRQLLDNCAENRAARREVGMAALRDPDSRQERRFFRVLHRRATSPFTGVMSRSQWDSNDEAITERVRGWRSAPEEELALIVESE